MVVGGLLVGDCALASYLSVPIGVDQRRIAWGTADLSTLLEWEEILIRHGIHKDPISGVLRGTYITPRSRRFSSLRAQRFDCPPRKLTFCLWNDLKLGLGQCGFI